MIVPDEGIVGQVTIGRFSNTRPPAAGAKTDPIEQVILGP